MPEWLLPVALADGLLMLLAAVAKARSPAGAVELIQVTLKIPRQFSRFVLAAVTSVEAILGLWILTLAPRWPLAVLLSAAVLAISTGVLAIAVHRKITQPCGCFGSTNAKPASWYMVSRNLVVLAVILLVSLGVSGRTMSWGDAAAAYDAPASWLTLHIFVGTSFSTLVFLWLDEAKAVAHLTRTVALPKNVVQRSGAR